LATVDPTLKFALFMIFSAAALTAGYGMRKRGLAHESLSRPVHWVTLVVIWSPIVMVMFWRLDVEPQLAVVMLIQPVMMLWCWLVGAALARWLRLPRHQAGVLVLCSALSNQGFTLGGFLCYVLLTPAEDAMSYAVAYVTSMQVFMVLIFYPVARHYGPGDSQPVGKLIAANFTDIRALPLVAAAVGTLLSVLDVGRAFAQSLVDIGAMDVGFFLGAAGSYLGIGLRLRLGDSARYWRLHGALAVVRFAALPLATGLVVWLAPAAGLPLAPLPRDVLMIESFTPVAINAVIISNLFHLDARAASVLWLWNTVLFCLIPLPVLLIVY
jgi:predicted permease